MNTKMNNQFCPCHADAAPANPPLVLSHPTQLSAGGEEGELLAPHGADSLQGKS